MAEQPHGSVDTDARKEAILAATVGQLVEHGYDKVRLRDIARAAGVSIGLVQHYFDTREQLLSTAFQWSCDELVAKWTDLASDEADPWDRLVTLVDGLVADVDFERHCASWVQFCATAYRVPELRAGVARIQDVWRRHFGRAITDGVGTGRFVPRLPPQDIVELLLALIDGCEVQVAARLPGATAAQARKLILDSARAHLMPDDAPSSLPR